MIHLQQTNYTDVITFSDLSLLCCWAYIAHMDLIPADWALATTHIISEYVYNQFSALVSGKPNTLPSLKLNFDIFMGCSKLASTLAHAYYNQARYADALQIMEKGTKPDCEANLLAQHLLDHQILLDQPTVNDMVVATSKMLGLLVKSDMHSAKTDGNWKTHKSNFYLSQLGVTLGCISPQVASRGLSDFQMGWKVFVSGNVETGGAHYCGIEGHASKPLLVIIGNNAGP
ncbi:hypothetical protein EDB19DRAFT_1834992 [Suillus lakei]|nr:hypothetical protein EDB19DRAFT_1834992 [Suillus lakei]